MMKFTAVNNTHAFPSHMYIDLFYYINFDEHISIKRIQNESQNQRFFFFHYLVLRYYNKKDDI